MKKIVHVLLAVSLLGAIFTGVHPSVATETPIPNDERLGGNCANHLVKFEVVKTDCTVSLTKNGVTYCFLSDTDQKEFEQDLEGNMSKSRAFYQQVVKPGKYVPIPAEAFTPRALPTVVSPK